MFTMNMNDNCNCIYISYIICIYIYIYYILLYYIILYCIVLYCIVLYCIVLYCIILYYIILYYIIYTYCIVAIHRYKCISCPYSIDFIVSTWPRAIDFGFKGWGQDAQHLPCRQLILCSRCSILRASLTSRPVILYNARFLNTRSVRDSISD